MKLLLATEGRCECENVQHGRGRAHAPRAYSKKLYTVETRYGAIRVCGGCKKNHVTEVQS